MGLFYSFVDENGNLCMFRMWQGFHDDPLPPPSSGYRRVSLSATQRGPYSSEVEFTAVDVRCDEVAPEGAKM